MSSSEFSDTAPLGSFDSGYAPRTNVRIRTQDEPVSPERKARDTKRTCRARVSLPSKDGRGLTSFECTSPAHSTDAGHVEVGRVRLRNNRTYSYVFRWYEAENSEIWREEKHGNTNAG